MPIIDFVRKIIKQIISQDGKKIKAARREEHNAT